MSAIDALTRVDVICKKWDDYDVDNRRAGGGSSVSGDDAFARLFAAVDDNIELAAPGNFYYSPPPPPPFPSFKPVIDRQIGSSLCCRNRRWRCGRGIGRPRTWTPRSGEPKPCWSRKSQSAEIGDKKKGRLRFVPLPVLLLVFSMIAFFLAVYEQHVARKSSKWVIL